MPLIRSDLIRGRSEKEIADLLDAAHEAMLEAFRVPVRDRYQIVQEHDASRLRIEDTGLGIERTDKVVIVTVTSRPRTKEQDFYRLPRAALQKKCGIAPSDVMVSIVENTDADWSFGNGEAQFLTGKLGASAKA
jgi:hypothetical protein